MRYPMNSRGDLPGPGDCEPPDYSDEDVIDELVAQMTPEIIDEWINDASMYGDYSANFSVEAWKDFERHIAAKNFEAAGAVYRMRMRSYMAADARIEARKRIMERRKYDD